MNNKCQYLRIRTKNYTKYTYCTHFKAPTSTNECSVCELYSHKQMFAKSPKKVLKTNVTKKSKKRTEQVKEETYNAVYERDKGRCVMCGSNEMIQLHHISGRGKDKTNNIDNCVMLCRNCHFDKVHQKNKFYKQILLTYIENIKH